MAEVPAIPIPDDLGWSEDGTIRLDQTVLPTFHSLNGETLKSKPSARSSNVSKEINNTSTALVTPLSSERLDAARPDIEARHSLKRSSQRQSIDHRCGRWSEAEDNWLISLVHRYGAHNWVRISQEIATRSPKQCRERYHEVWPRLNYDPITLEEGEQIERMVEEMGKRWAEIARRLDGPSDDAVKNWWNGSRNRRKGNAHRIGSLHYEELDEQIYMKPSPLTQVWGFLPDQQQQPVLDAISQGCPSLTSASNVSSRNSSTRSTKSLRWQGVESLPEDEDEHSFVEKCPVSTCLRPFKDLKSHMLMHHVERPEKCPVTTCEYHTKGFAGTYDKLRHTSTHFKGTLVCGFCPTSGPNETTNAYDRLDVFLHHLVSLHGVQQTLPSRRRELDRMGFISEDRVPNQAQLIAICSSCSEPFDAQGLYEHLPGCVLRKVAQECCENESLDVPADIQRVTDLKPTAHGNRSRSANGLLVRRLDNGLDCGATGDPAGALRNSSFSHDCEDWGNANAEEGYMIQEKENPRYRSEKETQRRPCEQDITTAMKDVEERPEELQRGSNEHCDPMIGHDEADVEELTASSRCLSLTSSAGLKSSSEEETDWTEDAPSPQSEPDATRVLSPLKRQLVENIMQEFRRLFDRVSYTDFQHSAQIHACAGSNASGSTYSGAQQSYGSSSSDVSSMSRKRSLSGGNSPPPNGEKNNGDDPHKRRRPDMTPQTKDSLLPERRFACPYYKRNPGRHQTFTSCRDPGFITVARLKEHLYRRHLLPIQCHRCCSTFPNEPSLREHQRDPRGCEVQEQMPPEGFDKDQERKLKSKKRSLVYQSEEDKWKGVYRILFPDDSEENMPSPYIEYQPTGSYPEPSNIARFQEFSRLELPRLVRRTLEVVVEHEAQPLEEKMKERLVDIVKECQSQLFTMFQSTSSSIEEESVSAFLPQPTMTQDPPQTDTSLIQGEALENETFPDFEAFSSGFVVPAASTSYAIAEKHILNTRRRTTSGGSASWVDPNPHHNDLRQKDSSDSPDSGYDSTWTTVSFPQDTSFDSAHFYPDNGQVDLGGYYGLWSTENQALAANSFDPSTWAFEDTNLNTDGISMMAAVTSTLTR